MDSMSPEKTMAEPFLFFLEGIRMEKPHTVSGTEMMVRSRDQLCGSFFQ